MFSPTDGIMEAKVAEEKLPKRTAQLVPFSLQSEIQHTCTFVIDYVDKALCLVQVGREITTRTRLPPSFAVITRL